VRQIEGNDTVHLHTVDATHIASPYGLNLAADAKSTADLVNHCKIVDAMYKDMFHESTYVEGRIRNISTKQCVSVSGGALVMGSCTDTASLMRIVSMGKTDPTYRMELGGRVLDAPDHSTRAGLAMGAWTWNRGTNQTFKLEACPQSDGRASRLKMAHSNLYLHPAGTSLVQDAANSGGGFDWELVKGSVPYNESTYMEGRIRNVSTQQCISLSGSALVMGSCFDTTSFVRLVGMGDQNPVYRLEFDFQVLDAPGQSTLAGLAMGVWSWNGGKNQEFTLEESPLAGGRAKRLRMVHSGLYLHSLDASLVQDADATGSEFDWELIKGAAPSVPISRWAVRPTTAPGAASPDPGMPGSQFGFGRGPGFPILGLFS
jgi:hypothetical protein